MNPEVSGGNEGMTGGAFDLRELLQRCLEKWWLIVLSILLCTSLAMAYIKHSHVTYQARAVLQVDQAGKSLLNMAGMPQEDLRGADMLNTIVQNVKNSSVLLRVVRTNHLANDLIFLPSNTNHFSETKIADSLNAMLSVKLRPDTRLIDIVVTHPNADLSQKLANSVAQEFIRQTMEERFSTTRAANEMFYSEAARLKRILEDSERKVQTYKEQNQTVSLEERQNIVVEKLKTLNQKYSETKAERLQLDAQRAQISQLTNQPEALLNLPFVMQDPAASDLRRKIVEKEAEVNTLSLRYKPLHPKMITAQRELDDLRAALAHVAMQSPRWIQASYDDVAAKEHNLEEGLKEAQMESLELDRKGIEFNVLLRDMESDRAMYESVLRRLKETDLNTGLQDIGISIVEPAGHPGMSMRPSNALILTAASMVGLGIGVGLVFILKLLDGSIRTVDQAEGLLSLPVLATMPRTHSARKGVPPHVLVEEPGSVCSEGFRTLRTTAGLLLRPAGKKVVLFTSAAPGEGKTFCSVNHAISQAQEGKRTLLIDLDLRRPAIHKSFLLTPETPGVAEYLRSEGSLSSLVRETRYPNLFILPAGRKNDRPAEQLAHESVQQLIEEASREYDRVVLDTPPINAVSDGLLVLHLANVICLVVRTRRTSRRAVMRAIEMMARADFPPSGIVLNFMPQRGGYGCYYHYAPRAGYYREGVYSQPRDNGDITLHS